MYSPTTTTESNAYARVIRLDHAGRADGTLLGTFEHWFEDGTPSRYIIRSSRDDGRTWSTRATVADPDTGPGHPASRMWQPFLFEFPHRIGAFPAGTLLLVGNIVPADGSYTQFHSWRSLDHGRTWTSVGDWQRGGTFGHGIWEPFLALDAHGRLVAHFSDERDSPAHSQMLVHVTSNDGGITWGPVVRDVASAVPADRPGMPTVARVSSDRYVLSFENCGPDNCATFVKFSRDGQHWGPATDTGAAVTTATGDYPAHSPYLVYDRHLGRHGAYVLAGQNVFAAAGTPAAGNYRSVFVSTTARPGSWRLVPAPVVISAASKSCNANYSPNLLVGRDHSIRYTAPSSLGSSGPCGEITASARLERR